MNLKAIFCNGIKKTFDFKGRENRKQFWLFALMYFPLSLVIYGIFIVAGIGIWIKIAIYVAEIFAFVLAATLAWLPLISAIVRRLNDIGRKWYLVIFWYIPVLNIYLFYLLCKPSIYSNNN